MFVISNVVGPKVPIQKIFAGISRFLAMDLIVLALIILIPAISLMLPNTSW